MKNLYGVECRWLARAVSGSILFFVAAHLVTGGLPNVAAAQPIEQMLFFWFALLLVGYGVLWKWEVAGVVASLIGGTGFYLTEILWGSGQPGGWVLPMFFTPALLVLAAWWFDSQRKAI